MIQYVEKPTILSLRIHLRPGLSAAFADWQANLNAKIAARPGFISLEFLSPTMPNQDWLVVQRFGSLSHATNWKDSSDYLEMMSDLKELAVREGIEETVADESTISAVTEVIVAEVNPDKEQAYREWIAKIHLVEAKSPGFRGMYVQSPNHSKGKFWITLLQFDTMENLDRWLSSSARQHLLDESKSLISYLETHRVISPYAGWFASIAKVGELPALWKQTMIVLLVLFPIVMLEFKYLIPLIGGLNISLSTFIGNAVSVSLISFPMMPIAIYFLGWWLSPGRNHRKLAALAGTLVVVALYLFEIWFFWSFI